MIEPKSQRGGPRKVRNPKPGLYSRKSALASLDGRTKAARLMAEVEAALTAHVGEPTAPQAITIRTIALLCLRLDAACEKVVSGAETEHLDRHLAALCNSVRLGCLALGMTRPAASAPTLAAYLDQRAAARDAAA